MIWRPAPSGKTKYLSPDERWRWTSSKFHDTETMEQFIIWKYLWDVFDQMESFISNSIYDPCLNLIG